MRGSTPSIVPVCLAVAATLTGAGTLYWLAQESQMPVHDLVPELVFAFAFVVFAWVGSIILRTQPRHVIGWLCVSGGVLAGIEGLARSYLFARPLPTSTTLGEAAVVTSNLVGLPTFVVFFVALPLLFPSGRLPSSRWRPVIVGLVVLTVLQTILTALEPGPVVWDEVVVSSSNPIGTTIGALGPVVETIGEIGSVPLILGALALLIQRIRRAGPVERMQIKWAGSALALVVVSVIAGAVPALEETWDVVFSVALLFVPIAVGVAITRHGLYEIDRIVSRTVAYTIVTALLVAIYLASVVGLGAIARAITGGTDDLVVALSTLLVAGAFQPLRGRVQSLVDRRFNRAGYDATLTAEAFGRSLRDELDPAAISAHLSRSAGGALSPATVGVLLAPGGGR